MKVRIQGMLKEISKTRWIKNSRFQTSLPLIKSLEVVNYKKKS